MSAAPHPIQRALLGALAWITRYRYLKFGIVGASGTVVNLVVLHIGHEYLFHSIEAAYKKPYASLALAITLATISNFTWNRLWTWSDRVRTMEQERPTGTSICDCWVLSLVNTSRHRVLGAPSSTF